MKIIYCLLEIKTPGGIGRVTSIKANFLANIGHEVFIITTDQKDKPSYYHLDSKIKLINLNINILDVHNNNIITSFLKRKEAICKYYKELKYLIDKIRPDVVISTFSIEALFLYKINDGSKKILECHFNRYQYNIMSRVYHYSTLKKILAKYKAYQNIKIASKYDAFVTLTQEDYDLWPNFRNKHSIPNIRSFDNVTHNYNRSKKIIAIGHFNAQKSFDKLIKIWGDIAYLYPDWSLDIYGEGEDEHLYRTLIKQLNISRQTHIHKPTNQIQEIYNNASFLCMTSTYEGLPMVLLEAMACGLPCIAYTCKCGPKDVILNEVTGYIIQEDHSEEYKKRMIQLIEDKKLREQMTKNSYQYSEKYSESNIMNMWVSLFNLLKNE